MTSAVGAALSANIIIIAWCNLGPRFTQLFGLIRPRGDPRDVTHVLDSAGGLNWETLTYVEV